MNNQSNSVLLHSTTSPEEYWRQQRLQLLEHQKQAEHQTPEWQAAVAEFDQQLANIPLVPFEWADKKHFPKIRTIFDMAREKIFMPRKTTRKAAVGDFTVMAIESTGTRLKDGILSLSAMKCRDFQAISAFSTTINPNDKITASAPTVSAILPALVEYLDKDDILAHNMPILLKFLYKYGFDYRDNHKNRRLFDTQKMAEHKLSEVMDNFDLHTVCVYYGIFSNKISTLSDCLATAKIYAALLEEYGVE
ncbi:MAG: 3'-5' exonuclease [Neisseriaceae bacterium]|nr:3'-5' exonuclease [Neisseriaceae bacterium]MBQ9723956.1 3'-5' exonuclease [Neisseriaceae bacterium]